MSSLTSTKKRKGASNIGISDDGQVDRPAPALRAGAKKPAAQVDADDGLTPPAPVWGHVLLLDYMPCQEVRSALLTCKIMANGAVTCVHTLNVMQVCQMDGPAARRFPNVEEVNYFSLLSVNLRQTVERRLLNYTSSLRKDHFQKVSLDALLNAIFVKSFWVLIRGTATSLSMRWRRSKSLRNCAHNIE